MQIAVMRLKSKKMYILYALISLCIILLALSGTIMSQVDEPKFTVLESQSNIEIREYDPVIVAQVLVEGDRKQAISAGFRMLADYIFGINEAHQKIGMTAPVIQQKGEKISMAAPVTQQKSEEGQWKVKFVMPAHYKLETLPKPHDNRVALLSVPAKQYAVIRFSGLAGAENLQNYLDELQKFLVSKDLKAKGEPIFAFYNPPWTLPFLRRNEIMIELNK
jgi:hypothetical protein